MNSINKKLIVLIGLCCLFLIVFSQPTSDKDMKSREKNNNIVFDPDHPKTSKTLAKFHIDNNWSDAKAAGICTGEGTFSNPYIIEDKVINGSGYESCILIQNARAYFNIENCTLSDSEIGIKLDNTTNGIMNNLTFFKFKGRR